MKLNSIVCAAAIFGALAAPAYAYIDPGSGSMILQGVLAAIAAIAVTAKLWWHRLLVLLGIRKRTIGNDGAPINAREQHEVRDQ
ncbi:MAG TPA: hypothetical protein VFL45_09730 [Gammaproteobacteria bacterium]|nr:hypothetical protein [Gammaproteobacteria bacterium]HET7588345.1 hypothetical protein [Gammaproteobacteria bacterium]